ncbi:MAG: hypothetical protein HY265_08590 [Deltaproteobacteria bacterium]|nr:hypothetical protein [Deltaproteobacteria bacterium]
MAFIAEKFGVNEFRWNGDASNDRAYTELMQALDKNDVKKIIADASTTPLDINGVKIEFLNPPADSHLDTNNKSLIARLSYKDASFLFTGDIEAVGELALLKRNENIHTAILKVPHHGSRTSSTIDFLNKVQPRLAAISLGYLNPFGFPHPEILKRYEELKIPVIRTDISGAVTIETNGADIKTSTFR